MSARTISLVLLGVLLAAALPGVALAAPTISEYSAGNGPLDAATGPDGNVWFAEYTANKIARVVAERHGHRVLGRAREQRGGVGHHRGAGRQPLVHRGAREQDRADHARRRDHPVLGRHQRGQRAARDRGGAGREPLVHRDRRHGSGGSRPPDRSRSSRRASPPRATRGASPRAATATSGSPSTTRPGHIGRITTSGVVTEFPCAGLPSGIAAGPDGNLWFAESANPGFDRPHDPERDARRVLERPHP